MSVSARVFAIRLLAMYLVNLCAIDITSAEIKYSGAILGNPSDWTTSTDAYIGDWGDGSLTVDDGDDIVSDTGNIGNSGTGKVTISGQGSSWQMSGGIYVGYMGEESSGKLSIAEGASVVVNGQASIGYDTGTSGTVEVKGAGSTWQTERLYVGRAGTGTLKITGGAKVYCREGYAGYYKNATGSIELDGDGSVLYSKLSFSIGDFAGNGTLSITNGAVLTATSVCIGTGGLGVVNVTGTDSKLICRDGDLALGYGSEGGLLYITGGGLVMAESLCRGNYGSSDSTGDYGFVNMDSGGMLALLGDLDDSILQFLTEIDGDDVIRFWDYDLSEWSSITNAVRGEDYILEYVSDKDSELYGYTLLTVVPEPATLALLGLGSLLIRKRK